MFKRDWDTNAENFALSESDAYVDAIIIYRILLCNGYINLKLSIVEEFLESNGRIAYPSQCKTNKISDIYYDITYNNQEDQTLNKSTPHNVPACRASDMNYHTSYNHQNEQQQLQPISNHNAENGLVTNFFGPNTWNSYQACPNYYIKNFPQVQDINSKATNDKDHLSTTSNHNQMSNQIPKMMQPNFGTQVANSYFQGGMRFPAAKYYSQTVPSTTNSDNNAYQSTQADPVVSNNYFYPDTNLSTHPIRSANNQNNSIPQNTNNINQDSQPIYCNNGSNIQTHITNNSDICSFGKR